MNEQVWLASQSPLVIEKPNEDESDHDDIDSTWKRDEARSIFHRLIAAGIGKGQLMKYRASRLKVFWKRGHAYSKPRNGTIAWAESQLAAQAQDADARHGARELSVYQTSQLKIRQRRLRKEYLQKKSGRKANRRNKRVDKEETRRRRERETTLNTGR